MNCKLLNKIRNYELQFMNYILLFCYINTSAYHHINKSSGTITIILQVRCPQNIGVKVAPVQDNAWGE